VALLVINSVLNTYLVWVFCLFCFHPRVSWCSVLDRNINLCSVGRRSNVGRCRLRSADIHTCIVPRTKATRWQKLCGRWSTAMEQSASRTASARHRTGGILTATENVFVYARHRRLVTFVFERLINIRLLLLLLLLLLPCFVCPYFWNVGYKHDRKQEVW